MYHEAPIYLPVFLNDSFVGIAPKYIQPEEVRNNIYLSHIPGVDNLHLRLNVDDYDIKMDWRKFMWEERMYPFENPFNPSMPKQVLQMYVYVLVPKENHGTSN